MRTRETDVLVVGGRGGPAELTAAAAPRPIRCRRDHRHQVPHHRAHRRASGRSPGHPPCSAPAPHARVAHEGRRSSTLDLAGNGDFAPLTGSGGERRREAAKQLSPEPGAAVVPRAVGHRLTYDDVHGDWNRPREAEGGGAPLVRPDRDIAWRAQDMAADPVRTPRQVMRQLLAPR
ncbi:hypothetical protein ACIP88_23715 [Streptomyces uncialis]|uniref:aromatic-ring hydroxylase C-terminal domain-containing protein n=1 Tax=Streptomyces uncialis TaxID=1048205 RepID=UPI0038084345